MFLVVAAFALTACDEHGRQAQRNLESCERLQEYAHQLVDAHSQPQGYNSCPGRRDSYQWTVRSAEALDCQDFEVAQTYDNPCPDPGPLITAPD